MLAICVTIVLHNIQKLFLILYQRVLLHRTEQQNLANFRSDAASDFQNINTALYFAYKLLKYLNTRNKTKLFPGQKN